MSMLETWLVLTAAVLFVGGAALVWQGWRGVPKLSEPICRKCGYDLRGLNWISSARICPECGTDLARETAVSFGKLKVNRRGLVAGGVLMAVALILPFSVNLVVLMFQHGGRLSASTESLLAKVEADPSDKSSWQQLCDRYLAGKLKPTETAAAVETVIAQLKADPSRQGVPLSWSGDLLRAAITDGVVASAQLTRLCAAYYGPEPKVRLRPRSRNGKAPAFRVENAPVLDLVGLRGLIALREVTVDGVAVDLEPRFTVGKTRHVLSGGAGRPIEAEITLPLEAGTHTVVFQLDRGAIGEQTNLDLRYEGRPGQADRWPTTLWKQSLTMTRKLEVLPRGQHAVDLVTDPKLDPTKCVTVSAITVSAHHEARRDRLELSPRIQIINPPVPAVFRVCVELDGEKRQIYQYGAFSKGNSRGASSGMGSRIDDLPPALKSIKVILEPDPDFAEDSLDVDSIWGQPIVIENVKLERDDLELEMKPADERIPPAPQGGFGASS